MSVPPQIPTNDMLDVRDLVTSLQPPDTVFESVSVRKGVVVSIQSSTVSVTVTFSGDTQQIPGVRYVLSYFPAVGDTVLMVKQGTGYFIVDNIAEEFRTDGYHTHTTTHGHFGNSHSHSSISNHSHSVSVSLVTGGGSTSSNGGHSHGSASQSVQPSNPGTANGPGIG